MMVEGGGLPDRWVGGDWSGGRSGARGVNGAGLAGMAGSQSNSGPAACAPFERRGVGGSRFGAACCPSASLLAPLQPFCSGAQALRLAPHPQ